VDRKKRLFLKVNCNFCILWRRRAFAIQTIKHTGWVRKKPDQF